MGPKMLRLRRLLIHTALVCGSLLVVVLVLEGFFRLFPTFLPPGAYSWGRFDPSIGMNVVGGPVIYNKVRFLRREPNADGFMDVDHEEQKPAGVVRVGIFGDSYVESIQVPLDEVFFRRIPTVIAGQPVETFGFGIGGWGTLHSLMNYEVQAPRFDFDVVVHMFVENDLGGNAYLLQKQWIIPGTYKPYAKLSEDAPGFEIAYLSEPDNRPLWYRLAKMVKTRMLLAQFIDSRVRLLRLKGISVRKNEKMAEMAEVAAKVPRAGDLPSSWPPEYVEHVQELGRRILTHWAATVRQEGRHFAVFYVPRSESMLNGTYGLEETWRPWLGDICAELGIPLIEPSDAFRARLAAGEHVYDDHWTPAGHEVAADVLTEYLRTVLKSD